VTSNLGIAFSGNNIFFSELASENESVKLNNIECIPVDFNFEDSYFRHKSSQKDLTNIANEIQNYITKRGLVIFDAALTIGTSQAFILTLPIDYSGGKKSMNSKIYWELSNYFPDNYNEYVVNTYRLNRTMPCKESDEFLVIAVHKNTLEFIKRIFRICSLNLKIIDIDHFSAEYSLRKSYHSQLENKKVLIIGLKKGRIDYGIIENRKYKMYEYSGYNTETEFNLSIIRKLNTLFEMNLKSQGIDTIYLYGDNIEGSTVEAIRKMNKAPVEVMDPLNGLNAVELLLKDESIRKYSYRFAASCGAALRSCRQN